MSAPPERRSESRRLIIEKAVIAQKVVDHPIITRCFRSSTGLPAFVEGSPYLHSGNMRRFTHLLRDDISLMSIEPARKVFRHIDRNESYPIPESCTPYTDANGLGFYLKNVLPLVFVRTRKGDVLMEARVAMKYLRENATQFRKILDAIAGSAQTVLRPRKSKAIEQSKKYLLTDIVQPYNSFTDKHISMRAGIWVHTPPRINTIIGPAINQTGPLSVLSGSIETDWHHFELFVVAEKPDFEDRVLFVGAGTTLAQLFFVDREIQGKTETKFSRSNPGADPEYARGWNELGMSLTAEAKTVDRGGIGSVQIGCPHCFVSVTSASENELPEGHVLQRSFNPAYKVLKQEFVSKS